MWTKDARKTEKEALQAKAWDLWLNCWSEREIREAIDHPRDTVHGWLVEKRNDSLFNQPPRSELPCRAIDDIRWPGDRRGFRPIWRKLFL
jgi:hypothetical protein